MSKSEYLPEFEKTYRECQSMTINDAFQKVINPNPKYSTFEKKNENKVKWKLGEILKQEGKCVAIINAPSNQSKIYIFSR